MLNKREHRTLRAVTLCATLLLGACGDNRSPEQYVEIARTHLAKSAYREAMIELNNALQKDPKNREARWLLAQTALELGEPDKAERDARKAIEYGFPRSEALPLLVRAILMQQAPDRALTELSTAAKDAPAAVQAQIASLRGSALLFKGDIDAAEAEFRAAQALDASFPDALVGLALLQSMRKNYDDARKTLAPVLDKQPPLADAWALLGDIEVEEDNFAAAEAAFGKAIEARAHLTLERAKRALARIRQGKFKEAEADLQALGPLARHPYAQYVTGLAHFRQQRLREAGDAFELALAADPNFAPNRVYLAMTRLMLGQPEQALVHAEFIRSAAPQSSGANLLLGIAQASHADYNQARKALESSLASDPDNVATVQLLSTISLLQGDNKAALSYAKRLSALRPDAAGTANTLMMAQLLAGATVPEPPAGTVDAFHAAFIQALQAFRDNKFDDAAKRAEALRSAHPDQLGPINLLAAVYLSTGQWPKARTELEVVLQRQPDDSIARINLAKLELHERNFQRVKALVSPLVQQSPAAEAPALLLVAAEHGLQNDAAADQVLEELLKNNPSAALGRALLAGRALRGNKPERTLEYLAQFDKARMESSPALLELRGRAHLDLGQHAEALGNFERWAKLTPASGTAHFLRAESLSRLGRTQDAQGALAQAVKLEPKNLPFRIAEVRALTRSGQGDEAKAAAQRLHKDFGDQPEVFAALGWHALMTGDFATAADQLGRAFAQTPRSDILLERMAALWGLGKRDEAFKLINDWLAEHPQDSAALLQLAGAHLEAGQEEQAVRAYRKVLEIDPAHVPSLNNVAWLTRKSNPDEALEIARRTLELAPNDANVLDTLGMLYLDRNDLTQASWYVGKAHERNPRNPQISLHLAEVERAKGKTAEARKLIDVVLAEARDPALRKQAEALRAQLEGGR